MEAEVLTLYSNGIDANLWESGDYFTSEDPQFGQRGLNIGRDGKRGSGGMATALFPSLCLAILLFPLFPIKESGARLDITQPD